MDRNEGQSVVYAEMGIGLWELVFTGHEGPAINIYSITGRWDKEVLAFRGTLMMYRRSL